MNKSLLILSMFLIAACGKKEEGKEIQTDKIALKNITEKVEGLGQIQPELEVKITSDVAGRIMVLNGKPGDFVKKGKILVEIDKERYQAAYLRAKSSLSRAEANMDKSASELKRAKELREKGLISASEIEIAQADHKINKATIDQAKATLAEASDDLSKCTVRAPIDGIITIKNKEQGEIAQGSSFNLDVIMVVANLTKMETLVDITESDIVKIKLGQKVDLDVEAFPGETFEGEVVEIANAATVNNNNTDQVTNFEVKILITDKSDRFRPGMNATAQIKTNFAENVVAVPIQAVTARKASKLEEKKSGEKENSDADKAAQESFSEKKEKAKGSKKLEEVVFVVTKDNTVEKRLITKGISDDDYYQILTGLSEGDEVVVGPFSTLSTRLKDKDKILVKNDKFDRKSNTASN